MALIDGLPDEIAALCMCQLPLLEWPSHATVSKRWLYFFRHEAEGLRRSCTAKENFLVAYGVEMSTLYYGFNKNDSGNVSWKCFSTVSTSHGYAPESTDEICCFYHKLQKYNHVIGISLLSNQLQCPRAISQIIAKSGITALEIKWAIGSNCSLYVLANTRLNYGTAQFSSSLYIVNQCGEIMTEIQSLHTPFSRQHYESFTVLGNQLYGVLGSGYPGNCGDASLCSFDFANRSWLTIAEIPPFESHPPWGSQIYKIFMEGIGDQLFVLVEGALTRREGFAGHSSKGKSNLLSLSLVDKKWNRVALKVNSLMQCLDAAYV